MSDVEGHVLGCASDMEAIGIVQLGDPILERPVDALELPQETDTGLAISQALLACLPLIRAAHTFSGCLGLAAPQIGIDRAVAVVQPLGEPPRVLYNPTIVGAATGRIEGYEGCLSFFDVRAIASRAESIEVEHRLLSGAREVVTFKGEFSAAWQHEIDHLEGVLFTEHMPDGCGLLSLDEYRGLESVKRRDEVAR